MKHMILRDLVTRMSFSADTSAVRDLDRTISGVKNTITGLASIALGGWAAQTGVEFERLKHQMRALHGEGLEPVQRQIDTMKGGLFSEEDITRASVVLAQAGVKGQEAADMLKQAEALTVRTGGSMTDTVTTIVNAIEEGGLPQLLRRLGIESRESAEIMQFVEQQVGAAGGGIGFAAQQLTRRLRQALAEGTLDQDKFREEFENMAAGAAGAGMSVGARMTDIWNTMSIRILEGLAPALRWIETMLDYAEQMIDKYGNFAGIWDNVADAAQRAAQWFEDLGVSMGDVVDAIGRMMESELIKGATAGGLIMAILTRNPAWVAGAVGGAWLYEQFMGEWEKLKAGMLTELSPGLIGGATVGGLLMFLVTRNPLWITAGMAGGGAAGKGLEGFLPDYLRREESGPTQLAPGAQPLPGLRTPRTMPETLGPAREWLEQQWENVPDWLQSIPGGLGLGEKSSFNFGNINIYSNASDPREVAQEVRAELQRQIRAASMEYAPRMQG